MTDLQAFKADVENWLEENCPPSQRQPSRHISDLMYGGKNRDSYPSEDAALWLERCADKGFTVPEWPKEYGGGGYSPDECKIIKKAFKAMGCRRPVYGHGIWMLGPALLEFGSEEQKLEHIPRICRGEVRWCQGYSEPGAGSDLASLRTKCEDKGDHWLINGQKSWTTDGHKADWMFALVRTSTEGKKQEGISFILIDMESEGVEVNPITLINGNQDFCDTFLANVKVPKDNIVGGVNKGWSVAKGLLGHERTMMSQLQEFVPPLPLSLVDYGKEYLGVDEDGKLANPALRADLTRHLMNARAMQLSHARAFEEGMAGVIDMNSVSYFKAAGTEEDKRGEELRIAMMGSAGLGWEGEGFDQERELNATRKLLESKVYSLGGGTTEVQWNVVAKKLGLPE